MDFLNRHAPWYQKWRGRLLPPAADGCPAQPADRLQTVLMLRISAEGKSASDRLAIEFPLDTIKTLVATHMHIDRVGRIPCWLAVPLLLAPKSPYRADVVVIESTYGDRLHEDCGTRCLRLGSIIGKTLTRSSTVLVSASRIGRTQELLYGLEDMIHRKALSTSPGLSGMSRGKKQDIARHSSARSSVSRVAQISTNWPRLPIILDCPLASGFTAAYRELQLFWAQEALKRVKSGQPVEQLIAVDGHSDHLRMVQLPV